jgi:pimeloyl-ACP methyl ester carboxylesterase
MTGAVAAMTATAPQVFAQQTDPEGAFKFYKKGNVRNRYQDVGSGFPMLVTPGGGLNSRISNWATAVINARDEFKSDFRCITMDQRNASGGESTGPIPVDDPWGAFADDQLGLMDHLGIRQFLFFGNCIGGSFALKLMERAPERVIAGVLSQPIGHRPESPDVMYDLSRDVWAKEFRAKQPEVPMETIEKYLHNLYRVRPRFCVQCVARVRTKLPDADACPAGRHRGARVPNGRRRRVAGTKCRGDGLYLEGSSGTEGPNHQTGAYLPEGKRGRPT